MVSIIKLLFLLLIATVTFADRHRSVRAAVDAEMVVKFSLARTTSTSTTYLTTMATCVKTTSCAVTVGSVIACRRRKRQTRRPPLMDVDAIFPSVPFRIEATAAPQVPSSDELLMLNDPRDVLISGLSLGDCVQGSIGVTAIYTATATSSITCLSTETQTNTFTLSGCTPTGLSYCAITYMPPAAVSSSSSSKRP